MKSKQATVSAKIPRQLKEELERKGVNMSEAIRKGLERELKEMKTKELESLLQGIDFSKVSEERIVRDIRETREEH
jgi:Arc/MetJ-type ribon-helix-helix transcriptional regulator